MLFRSVIFLLLPLLYSSGYASEGELEHTKECYVEPLRSPDLDEPVGWVIAVRKIGEDQPMGALGNPRDRNRPYTTRQDALVHLIRHVQNHFCRKIIN